MERRLDRERWRVYMGGQIAGFAKLLALIAKLTKKVLLYQALRWGMV
jgi:hypothetical protein